MRPRCSGNASGGVGRAVRAPCPLWLPWWRSQPLEAASPPPMSHPLPRRSAAAAFRPAQPSGRGTASAGANSSRKRPETEGRGVKRCVWRQRGVRRELSGAPYPLRSQLQGWPRAAASSHRAARPWRRRSEGAAFGPAYEARGAALWCCLWAESRGDTARGREAGEQEGKTAPPPP